MLPGQATKRRSMTSVSKATPTEVPTHLSTSPSSQTAGICSSVKRVRGSTRDKKTSRLITQHGGKKLFVGVSRQDKFEIEGYNESPLAQEVIDTKATHLFKGWRYHMNQHYKALEKAWTDPYSKPFVGVSEKDWRYMIDHVFLGDTHKKWSERAIDNRKKLPYNHTMGSRSFSVAISIEGIQNGKEPRIVDFYKTSHWNKKKNDWIEPICVVLYEKMDQLREEASQSGATLLTQEQIYVQVLRMGSGYLKGFGVGPKSSAAFKSTAWSQAHDEEVKGLKEEVASLKGIIQSYEGCFE